MKKMKLEDCTPEGVQWLAKEAVIAEAKAMRLRHQVDPSKGCCDWWLKVVIDGECCLECGGSSIVIEKRNPK